MSEPAKTVAVVGAGIVGVQLARALQTRGAVVTLIDQQDAGTATSFGNAGYLATDEIFPLAHGTVLRRLPRMLLRPSGPLAMRWQEFPRLLPWYVRYALACSRARAGHSIAALAAIQREAVAAWRRVVVRDRLDGLIQSNGAMTVFESDRGFEETAAQREVQRRHGIEWQALSGAAAREKIPELSASIRHAVVFPGGQHVVNPYAVTEALFNAFIAAGGHWKRERVERLALDASHHASLCLSASTTTFDQIVVCAGHLSGRLLKPLGYRVPLVAERGYHVEMSHRETRLNLPVGSYERGFYVTPMSSGLRLAGTSEFSSADHDVAPTWSRADILKTHIAALMPGLAEEETHRWMGHRPTLPDFLPMLGRAAATKNLFVACGHHHLGLTLSAVTAELMTAVLYDEPPAIDLSPFDPARF